MSETLSTLSRGKHVSLVKQSIPGLLGLIASRVLSTEDTELRARSAELRLAKSREAACLQLINQAIDKLDASTDSKIFIDFDPLLSEGVNSILSKKEVVLPPQYNYDVLFTGSTTYVTLKISKQVSSS